MEATARMVQTLVLDCGMPLVVEVIPGVRSAALHWLIPAGSGTDAPAREGLAPMLAELLLRGAGDLDSRAQADAFDHLGVARDVDVGTTYLRLSASMIGAKAPAALPLIVDMVRRPRLEESAIEPSRELCLQSLSALADHPEERAGLLLRERQLPAPLNRSGLGTREGLSAITRADVVSHWGERARPVGSILAVAGAVDPAALARQLNELLKGWSGAAAPLRPSTHLPARGTHHHEMDPSNQVHIFVGHDAPAERDPDAALERVLAGVLSGGPSARLFTECRERRSLCYSVSASYAADKEFGRVVAYIGTTPDKAQQALDVLRSELQRVTPGCGGEITEGEHQRAVVGVKSSLIFSGESTSARAAALASDMHRLGRPRPLTEIAASIDAVTLERLREYAQRRKIGAMTSVSLGPVALAPGV